MVRRDGPSAGVQLSAINLNLLVSLEALLREAHVGRAARRVGVTQSAMSQSLRQLRELYQDPLLVRSANGMVRTPRGDRIAAGLRRGLSELRGTLVNPELDPARIRRTYTLAISDAVALAIVPELMRVLAREAPAASINVQALEPRPHMRLEMLELGQVDLAFGADLDRAPGLRRHRLYDAGFVGLASVDNTRVSPHPTRAEYAALSHVVYNPPGAHGERAFVDSALEQGGLARHIVLRTSYLLLASWVVAESEHVLVVRRHMAPALMRKLPLRAFELPIDVPDLEYEMVWHERYEEDPAHAWLRERVLGVAAGKAPSIAAHASARP